MRRKEPKQRCRAAAPPHSEQRWQGGRLCPPPWEQRGCIPTPDPTALRGRKKKITTAEAASLPVGGAGRRGYPEVLSDGIASARPARSPPLPPHTADAERSRLRCGAAGGAGNPAPLSPRAPRGLPKCRPGSPPALPREAPRFARRCPARRGRGSGRARSPAHAQRRAPDPQRPPPTAALPSAQGGRTHRGAGAGGGAGGRRALHRDQSHRGAAAEPPGRPAGAFTPWRAGRRGGWGGGAEVARRRPQGAAAPRAPTAARRLRRAGAGPAGHNEGQGACASCQRGAASGGG